MFTSQSTQTPAQYKEWLNQKSPFLKDYSFYDLKKGDKVSVLNNSDNKRYNCTFIKYEIIELGTGFFISFGPKNFKRAKHIVAIVEHINVHNIKMKWRIQKEGYTEIIEVI
jgi:hypothetical protein